MDVNMMDLTNYSLENLFLAAIKSEMDSREVYSGIAGRVNNAFLKEKMQYLAAEEDKHREYVSGLWKKQFPGKNIAVPDASPVPMPEVNIDSQNMPLSEVIEQAMEAETAAHDFYMGLASRFLNEEDDAIKRTLEYFARMEKGHYSLLQMERDNLLNFEDYDQYFPMMHVGP